ncbi:MAG: SRPBCC family protein [Vicinamibacterales bacterium]
MMETSHHLHRRLVIRRSLEEVFSFFAEAGNLERITPPELKFHILTPQPVTIQHGSLIDYQLALFGMRFGWRTLISTWEPPHLFVDTQVRGPYRQWTHTHRFVQNPDGAEVFDHVEYQLPLWPIGEIALPMVRRQIGRIFDYREQVIREVFP